jgi:hypothetical protein
MPGREKLAEFTTWCAKHVTGDEKGEAQIFLDHLFQAFGHSGGLKEAGTTLEFRGAKDVEAGGGTSFADLVWKPIVLIEMKKRGENLQEHYRQAFDYWTRVFDTFPWPQTATVKQIDAVAAAARELRRVRAEALPKLKGGLRALYRTLELPGANPLKDAHAALDTAVLTAYGFSAKKDLLAQLLALNQQVAAKIEKGEPVMPPGVPKNYPDAKKLVTGDCIRPAEVAV